MFVFVFVFVVFEKKCAGGARQFQSIGDLFTAPAIVNPAHDCWPHVVLALSVCSFRQSDLMRNAKNRAARHAKLCANHNTLVASQPHGYQPSTQVQAFAG
jgi:hypothetical protein